MFSKSPSKLPLIANDIKILLGRHNSPATDNDDDRDTHNGNAIDIDDDDYRDADNALDRGPPNFALYNTFSV